MSECVADDLIPVEMESSTFSLVVFMDVPRSYPPNTSVICSFVVTEGLKPSSGDWIGVFKVGWNSTQKYHNYVWVKPPSNLDGPEPHRLQIVFNDYYLPKDDGEFYQFCYVDSSGQVRGASTPFCFQNPEESSQENSLEKDLLVITTPEQAEQMEKEKKDLLTEMGHLKEENGILKHELEDRLHEIHRLRIRIDKLKSVSTDEAVPSKELKTSESVEEVSQDQLLLSHETTQENESALLQDKYDKAIQKILLLKEEKVLLKQQFEAQQAEISDLKPRVKEAEQGFNRLQDHIQLLQVDLQSIKKENERLHAENQELKERKREADGLWGENIALATSLSEPSDEDIISNTKEHIQALLKQLTEARGTLRKEIVNSKETSKRAEKAELELRELKMQLEQRPLAEERKENSSQTEMELEEARRRIGELENMAEVKQLEKEELCKENEGLRNDVSRLQKHVYELEVASVAAVAQQQHSPLSPSFTDPFTSQQQPHSGSHYYESITELSGTTVAIENKKVCRHCQESFPDISEDELAMHEQSHKVCPFCTLICDDLEQQEFEDHVYGHE